MKTASSPRIRVFVVDDHPIVRRGFQLLFGVERDFVVCGEADSGPVALEKILALKPDVAIIDLSLKLSSGMELVKQLRSLLPQLKMLVFTMRSEAIYAERAIKAGANGFLTKDEGTEKAVEAIRSILAGKTYVSEEFAGSLLHRVGSGAPVERPGPQSLSDRELEVLELLGHGLGSRDVADRLHLSLKTVESHREHIKSKLGLKSASELVNYAFSWVQNNA